MRNEVRARRHIFLRSKCGSERGSRKNSNNMMLDDLQAVADKEKKMLGLELQLAPRLESNHNK